MPIALQLGMPPPLLHAGILSILSLCRARVGCHNHCEFIITKQEQNKLIVSLKSSSASASSTGSVTLSLEGKDVIEMSYVGHQLWISVLIGIY